MKHFIVALILLGLTNLSLGQNIIAMETSNLKLGADLNKTKSKSKEVKHSEFIASFENEELPKKVLDMHSKVEQFNLKSLSLFTPEEKAYYNVIFNEGDSKIEANYNCNGELTQSIESYENVRIPYSVSSKLSKEYPGWAFNKTLCKITYNKFESPKISYHVTMDKDGKRKTIKVNI